MLKSNLLVALGAYVVDGRIETDAFDSLELELKGLYMDPFRPCCVVGTEAAICAG